MGATCRSSIGQTFPLEFPFWGMQAKGHEPSHVSEAAGDCQVEPPSSLQSQPIDQSIHIQQKSDGIHSNSTYSDSQVLGFGVSRFWVYRNSTVGFLRDRICRVGFIRFRLGALGSILPGFCVVKCDFDRSLSEESPSGLIIVGVVGELGICILGREIPCDVAFCLEPNCFPQGFKYFCEERIILFFCEQQKSWRGRCEFAVWVWGQLQLPTFSSVSLWSRSSCGRTSRSCPFLRTPKCWRNLTNLSRNPAPQAFKHHPTQVNLRSLTKRNLPKFNPFDSPWLKNHHAINCHLSD